MARIVLPESRIRARRKRRITRAAVAWATLLLMILTAVIGVAWVPQMRFSVIDVVGTQTVDVSIIRAATLKELSGRYWGIFPKDNVFLYPKEQVGDALLTQFSPIKTVSVDFENFHTLRIKIEERTPRALWCGEDTTASIPCTLLDQSGVAYTQAPDFMGGVYVQYYGSLATTTPPQYLVPGQFPTLAALVDVLQQKVGTDRVAQVYVDENADVHAMLLSSSTLLFSLDQDGGAVVNNFSLALESDVFVGHPLSDFEYVDLRFGDKLYYKLK